MSIRSSTPGSWRSAGCSAHDAGPCAGDRVARGPGMGASAHDRGLPRGRRRSAAGPALAPAAKRDVDRTDGPRSRRAGGASRRRPHRPADDAAPRAGALAAATRDTASREDGPAPWSRVLRGRILALRPPRDSDRVGPCRGGRPVSLRAAARDLPRDPRCGGGARRSTGAPRRATARPLARGGAGAPDPARAHGSLDGVRDLQVADRGSEPGAHAARTTAGTTRPLHPGLSNSRRAG
jgi:hypothetical protein